MPLSDFVRYLNTQPAACASAPRVTTPFVADDGQVFVHFAGLRLESFYSPIVDLASGEVRGHAAGLHACGLNTHQLLEPDALFVLASDDDEFIYLDRLGRTLHALNYLTYLNRHVRGTLLLRVHPRYVASAAASRGMAFEDALRACGLLPQQITLEIEIDGCDGGDGTARLLSEIADYKARGYGIAVGRFGRREINFSLLREISPSIVSFDPLLLASKRPLGRLLDRLHELGALAMIGGRDSVALRQEAGHSGFDLLQALTPRHRPLSAVAASSFA